MNIEDKNYAKKVNNWINNLEDFKEKITDTFFVFLINYPPFKGLVVQVSKVGDRHVVIFYKGTSSPKVYYPKKIEYSFTKEIDRTMLSIKTDKFWAYCERVEWIAKLTTMGFGMDMTMPFLAYQDWRII